MRKSGMVIIALAGAIIIFAAFIRPADPLPTDTPKNMPDSVWSIVKKSCYDCHANDGNSMAKAKLNFDKWDDYSSDKRLGKAQDICSQLKKAGMPPSKYRKNNPESVPTDAEVAAICQWASQTEK